MKTIKLFAFAFSLMAFMSCNDNKVKEQANDGTVNEVEQATDAPEAKKDEKLKLKVDAEKGQVGMENEDVDIDINGDKDE